MALNNEDTQPNAYQVDDDKNENEKDLRRTFLFGKGDEEKSGNEPGLESDAVGGHRFGENSNTPAGDDKNNPSQNAGYSNEYFRRNEPLEEHPEDDNFKDPNQLGQPNYTQASDASLTGQSDEENTGPTRDDDQGEEPGTRVPYREGTADNDGNTADNKGNSNDDDDVAGYNELPEHQKVGE